MASEANHSTSTTKLAIHQNSSNNTVLSPTIATVGAVIGAKGAIPLTFTVLNYVGFTTAGVAVSTIASTTQSVLYGGATCGKFALLQSATSTVALGPIASIAIPVVGAITVGYVSYKSTEYLYSNSSQFRNAVDTTTDYSRNYAKSAYNQSKNYYSNCRSVLSSTGMAKL